MSCDLQCNKSSSNVVDARIGTSGPVKLAKKEAKPAAAAPKKTEPKTEKKTAEKKAPAAKKATATVRLPYRPFVNLLANELPEG